MESNAPTRTRTVYVQYVHEPHVSDVWGIDVAEGQRFGFSTLAHLDTAENLAAFGNEEHMRDQILSADGLVRLAAEYYVEDGFVEPFSEEQIASACSLAVAANDPYPGVAMLAELRPERCVVVAEEIEPDRA